MASTAIGMDWTHRVSLERELLAERGLRCHWIVGQNNSNMGC